MVARHLISLICLLAATVAAAQVPEGQPLVNATLGNDYLVYSVTPTGSMLPAIDENCWVVMRMLPWSDIRPGDIVMYASRTTHHFGAYTSNLILHAVWARSSGGSVLILKEYANDRPDRELVTQDMYRGTLVAILKKPRGGAENP